jgi:MFS family permease
VPLVPLFYVRVINAPDAWIGRIGTSQALAVLLGYWFWRRASRRKGTRFVVIWSTIGAAVAPGALALTHDVALAALVAAAGAVFTAGVNLAMFDRMMSTVPAGYGVTFSSVDTGLGYLAGIAGPLVAASLADRIGIAQALAVASVGGLLGAALFTFDRGRTRAAKATAALPAAPAQAPEESEATPG